MKKFLKVITKPLRGYWFWIIIIAFLSYFVFKKIDLLGIIDPKTSPEIAWLVHSALFAPLTGIILYPIIIYPIGNLFLKKE